MGRDHAPTGSVEGKTISIEKIKTKISIKKGETRHLKIIRILIDYSLISAD